MNAQRVAKIRLLGVTNFDTKHIQQMLDNGVSIVSAQAQYSLLDRRPERHMSACCTKNNLYLLPYGVLAGGFLSERYLGHDAPSSMNRSLQKYRLVIDEIGGWDAFQRLLELLNDVANKHETTIDAIAARWTLDRPGVAAIILGVGKHPRAQQNLALSNLQLDNEDRQKIMKHLEAQAIPRGDMYDLERDPDGSHTKVIKHNLQDDR